MTLTASVGVASARDAADPAALAQCADRRLCEAKHAGRNRVAARAADYHWLR
jgi:PleD family two-component response regulator